MPHISQVFKIGSGADPEKELEGMDRPRRSGARRQRCKTAELAKRLHGRTLSWSQDVIQAGKIKSENIEWQFSGVELLFSSLNGSRSKCFQCRGLRIQSPSLF